MSEPVKPVGHKSEPVKTPEDHVEQVEKARKEKEEKRKKEKEAVQKQVEEAAKAHDDLGKKFLKEDEEEATKGK